MPHIVRHMTGLAALLAVLLSVAPAAADIVPLGQKKIRQDVFIDFGPYADYSTWTYVVKQGDTLTEIAQQHLGTMKRHKEILALNKGLSAESLKADEKILMPPRKQPLALDGKRERAKNKTARLWWDFYGAKWNGQAGLARMSSGEALPFHHYGTRLYAVRHDKAAEFEKLIKAKNRGLAKTLDNLAKQPWVMRASADLGGYATVSDGARQVRETLHYRIVAFGESGIVLKHGKTEKLDKDGKPVAGSFLGLSGNLFLMFLAFLGLLGLVLVVARRSRAHRTEIPVRS